ncbi:winged helix-turn-helix transcriptional regulator [Nocardia arizonensis]|uniref:winged helix-turn-helix transcriptional regulator n=1 Tax=Nocardia arizonensis TaxID=1141647 RepID=UPI0006CF4227|nr:helix-turn-helix domain-containing protein [Nocardia arizonensis]
MTVAPEHRGKRSYQDACGAARALDLVGERWTLLVVRDLLHGPKRFTDLRSGLPAISPNVLSQRLEELVNAGIVCKRKLPPPVGAAVYDLTAWGRELDTVILALNRWGAKAPRGAYRCADLSTDSVVVSLRSFFDPAAAVGVEADYDLYFTESSSGEDEFHAVVTDGTFTITRGVSGEAATTIHTSVPALVALVFDGLPYEQVRAGGDFTVSGDEAAAERFAGYFDLPSGCMAPR